MTEVSGKKAARTILFASDKKIGRDCLSRIRKQNGFTLVEMLAVVAILSILLVLVVPAAQKLVIGYRLNSSGNQLAALIERARVHATVTQRVAVLRIYADPANPDAFRILQVLEKIQDVSDTTTPVITKPLTRGYVLESPIMISTKNSSVFSNHTIVSDKGPFQGASNVPYREIYFFPNGSTSLEATEVNPYFTLLRVNDDTAHPDNPFIVSLDPVTTGVTIFRR